MLIFHGEEEAFQQNRIQPTNHISCYHIFNATNHGVGIDKTLRVSMSILLTPAIEANVLSIHDDVIKWKHFPRNWPFVRGIHRGPVNSPHNGQWRGAVMFSLMCVWIDGWVKNREAGDLRRYRVHCDVTVMPFQWTIDRCFCQKYDYSFHF